MPTNHRSDPARSAHLIALCNAATDKVGVRRALKALTGATNPAAVTDAFQHVASDTLRLGVVTDEILLAATRGQLVTSLRDLADALSGPHAARLVFARTLQRLPLDETFGDDLVDLVAEMLTAGYVLGSSETHALSQCRPLSTHAAHVLIDTENTAARLGVARALTRELVTIDEQHLTALVDDANTEIAYELLLEPATRNPLTPGQLEHLFNTLCLSSDIWKHEAVALRILASPDANRWTSAAQAVVLSATPAIDFALWLAGRTALPPSADVLADVANNPRGTQPKIAPNRFGIDNEADNVLHHFSGAFNDESLESPHVRELLERHPGAVTHLATSESGTGPVFADHLTARLDARTSQSLEPCRGRPSLEDLARIADAARPATLTDLLDIADALHE